MTSYILENEENNERESKSKLPPGLLANARELRKRMTDAEKLLWELLRSRKFCGLKFRREHPIRQGFILDFYCEELKLDLEIDGGYHNKNVQKEYDNAREQELNTLGIQVIRFTNKEVLEQTEIVLQKLADRIPLSYRERGKG